MQVGDERRIIGVGQRHEAVVRRLAPISGLAPAKLMWSVIATSAGGAPFLVEAAGGVGEEQRLAAEPLERLDRDAHRVGVAALVIMAAALEESDRLPSSAPTTSRPAWPATLGTGKPGMSA